MVGKKLLLFLISIVSFAFFSCIGVRSAHKYFNVRLYDENNKQIVDFDRMDDFNLMLIDNSKIQGYKGSVDITLVKKELKTGKDPFYELSFFIGANGRNSVVEEYIRRFEEASKFMKIRIEDRRGEYKTQETSPLSDYVKSYYSHDIDMELEKN